MNVLWDPQPTFTGLPTYKPDATPDEIAAINQRMWRAYSGYATELDALYPLWHFEILAVRNPARELVELAQQRREREGKP